MNFSAKQIVIVVVAGAVLWLAAALCIRYLGFAIFDFGVAHTVAYFALFPITWVFVRLVQNLAELSDEDVFLGIGASTMTAVLLNGLALAMYPDLYSLSFEIQVAGAAFILWGAGVTLAVAWWESRR